MRCIEVFFAKALQVRTIHPLPKTFRHTTIGASDSASRSVTASSMSGALIRTVLLLGFLVCGVHGAPKSKRPRRDAPANPAKKPSPPPAPASTFAADAHHTWTFSVTITPYKSQGAPTTPHTHGRRPIAPKSWPLTQKAPMHAAGVPYTDEERMSLVATIQDHLYVEMGMRHQDAEVPVFSFSRERGLENREPHINGHYDINTTETDKPLTVKREHARMKEILNRVTTMPTRLVLKMIPTSNRTYGYGYDFKDMARARPRRHHAAPSPASLNAAPQRMPPLRTAALAVAGQGPLPQHQAGPH
jgi:hypothetical protein